MINYDFLYDKTHYDRYTRVNHFSKENLSWKVYDEATVLPFSRGYSEVVGGLLDSKGKYIDGSGLHRGMGYAYTFNEGKVKYRDETIVLLGIWPNIWGHWLTDNIRRLWVLKNKEFMSQYGNCRFIYLPFDHQNIGKNARELLEILGIKDITLEAEDEIIRYKRVILPDECFFCAPDSNRYYTKEYVSMINEIRAFAKNGWTDTGLRKVYFTYKGYSLFRSMCEDRLERFFADQGYRIISPEEYTFREQLDILLSCTHFASTVGSAAHNIVFLKDKAKVYLIPRTDFISTYQFALDEIHDLDITYVDSSMSVYTHPERPWEGPFYYIISDNLLGLFGRKAGRRNNSRGFSGYRRIGIWMNGHHNISDYYRKEYGKYMDVPIEKAENVPMIFQLCEKLHIRILMMKIMFRLEALYAYLRHDNR